MPPRRKKKTEAPPPEETSAEALPELTGSTEGSAPEAEALEEVAEAAEEAVEGAPNTSEAAPNGAEEAAEASGSDIATTSEAAKAEPDDDLPYRIGTWKGRPNYGCKAERCKFESLDRLVTLAHITDPNTPHNRRLAPKKVHVRSELVGADGAPLAEKE